MDWGSIIAKGVTLVLGLLGKKLDPGPPLKYLRVPNAHTFAHPGSPEESAYGLEHCIDCNHWDPARSRYDGVRCPGPHPT